MNLRNSLRVFCLCFLLSTTCSASATDNVWWGSGGDGLWSNPTNWSLGVVPDASQDVWFQYDHDYYVTVNSAAEAKNIRLDYIARNLTITGSGTLSCVSLSGNISNHITLLAPAGSGLNSVSFSGTINNYGTIRAETNAVFEIHAQTENGLVLRPGTVLEGPGIIRVGGGSSWVGAVGEITLNTTVEVAGSIWAGDGSSNAEAAHLSGPGMLNWLGGYLGGYPEPLILRSNLHVVASGPGDKSAWQLINEGEIRWQGGIAYTDETFENHGRFILETNCSLGGFKNYGTVVAAADKGTVTLSPSLWTTNYGTLQAETNSVLEIEGNGLWHDGTVVAGPGTVRVTGAGIIYIDGTTIVNTTLENVGHLEGGNSRHINGSIGQLTGPGVFRWSGGMIGGYPFPLMFTTNFHAEVSGMVSGACINYGELKWLDGNHLLTSILNYGEMRWLCGSNPLTSIHNYGELILETNCTVRGIENYGRLLTAASTTFTLTTLDEGLENQGTLQAETNSVLEIEADNDLLYFRNGTILDGPGTIRLKGPGLIYVDGTTTVKTTLEHLGHLEVGSGIGFYSTGGILTGPGLLKWLGGSIGGSPQGLVFDADFHIQLSGPEDKYLDNDGCLNYGDMRWLGGGSFLNGFEFKNYGEFILETNCSMEGIENFGRVIAASHRTATLTLNLGMDNYGILKAETNAVLEIDNREDRSYWHGGTQLIGPGTIRVKGPGRICIEGTTSVDTTLENIGYLLAGNGTTYNPRIGMLTGSGSLKWLAGYIGGFPRGMIFDTGFHVELSGPSVKELLYEGCENYGEMRWLGGSSFESHKFLNFGVFRVETNCLLSSTDGVMENIGALDLLAGTLTVSNGFGLTLTGETKVTITGPLPSSQYGKVNYLESAQLDGTLSVVLTNGFGPSPGQSFTLFSFPAYNGQFSSIKLPALPSGHGWLVDYEANAFKLTVGQATPLTSLARLTDGSFQFNVTNGAASKAVVQATTNLESPVVWENLATNAPFTGSLSFSDPNTASHSQRFYRVLLVPY